MSEIEDDNINHWLGILSENDPSNETEYNEALEYVRENFMEIHKNDFFLSLEREIFCQILDSDDLNVENEETVFDCVRCWLKFNCLDPDTHLELLLEVVRLPLLPIKYLFDEVEPYVYPILNCRDIFLDVLRYHIFGKTIKNTRLRKYRKMSLENIKMSEVFGTTPKPAKPGMKLLSIGSDSLNNANVVEIYDDNLNQWIKPNSLAVDRRNYSVALIDGKVMLIGGTRSPDENTEPLKTVQSLDLSTGLLSTEAALNDARQYSASVVVGKGKMSFLYVLGGRGKEKDLDSVERWDPWSREWTHTQSMINKRTGLAAAVLNDKIYVIGGKIGDEHTNTMEAYNPEDAEWEVKASMKEARAHFCVAVYENSLYAVAGSKTHQLYLNTVEKYDPNDDSWVTIANILAAGHVGISSLGSKLICAGGNFSTSVLEYNDIINKWSKLKGLHVPRAGHLLELPIKMKDLEFDWLNIRTTSCSNKLLMIGNQNSSTTCILEVYDKLENQWTALNNLNIGKTNYSVAYFGENLLMIGGTLPNNYDLNSVESLNLRTGKVSQIAPLNCRRQHSAAVVVNQELFVIIYVFGGMKNGKLLESVERWDSLSRTWTMITPMTVARTGHGAVLLQNEIYVVGGIIGDTYDKTVEAYDIKNDRWTTKSSMNNANAYFGITTFKNCIFVVGGNRDSSTPVNTVERYDPAENFWTTIANISSTGTVGISGLGNKLICAGGKSSNIVEEYDEANNRWKKLSSLFTRLTGCLIELQPYIEIHLGDWSSNKLIYIENKMIKTSDLLNMEWTRLKDLPFPKTSFNVNLINNKLLFIGGCLDGHAVQTVDAFDLSCGKIVSFPSLKYARFDASSVVVKEGNKEILYVLGGSDKKNRLLSVEIWNPSNNEWTEGIPMIFERDNFCCAFLNDKIYIVGGFVKGSRSANVQAFNVKQGGTWKTKASMKYSRARFSIATFKNHIYVAGGSSSSVERYDPVTDSWTTLAHIKSNKYVGLFTIGDRLICADETEKYFNEYNVAKNKWVTLPLMNLDYYIGHFFELPDNAKLGCW